MEKKEDCNVMWRSTELLSLELPYFLGPSDPPKGARTQSERTVGRRAARGVGDR